MLRVATTWYRSGVHRDFLDDLESLNRRAACFLILDQRGHLSVVLDTLDRDFCLLILHNRLLLLLSCLLLRAVMTLELSDVLRCVWIGTIVGEHLDRLLRLLIAH